MAVFVEQQEMEAHACGQCGILYAAPKHWWDARRQDKKSIFCPNGHQASYHQTTEDQLRQKLAAAAAEAERQRQVREAAEARAGKAEQSLAQVTKAHRKMRERVMNGVCPCCTRSFANLREHMKSEHADFGTVKTLFALRHAFGMTQAAVAREAGVDTTYVSFYEKEKKLPAYAKERIEAWLDQHSGQAA